MKEFMVILFDNTSRIVRAPSFVYAKWQANKFYGEYKELYELDQYGFLMEA